MLGRRSDDIRVKGHGVGLDDGRLIAGIVAKDLRLFETLYRHYHPRLTHFLSRMLQRPALVDEVLNDTMLVVWNRADSFNGRSKVSTWIFAIAYRKALKALSRLDEPVEDPADDVRESPEIGPEQALTRREVQRALAGAIGDLSAHHRAVVDLAYFHDLGYHDIAEIMDCPVDTVKTRMFHARRYLRTLLAGQLSDWL